MNWKEFLKPGKKKTIVALVLFGTISFSFIGANFLIGFLAAMGCFDACDGTEPMQRLINFLFNSYSTIYKSMDSRALVASLIIVLGIFYLLSCLIVRIYDKHKKNRAPASRERG